MDGNVDRLAKLRQRVADAKARAAVDPLSAEDREEQALRAEAEQHEAEERAKAKEARTLDLARRLDEARERIAAATGQPPERVLLEPLDLEADSPGAGTCIVQAIPAKAHEKHTKAT
jgi:hypothetical protein